MSQVSLGEALQEFLNKSRVKGRVQALQIKDVWAELMGKTIATYTDDIQLVQHQLIITTHVAPLKQELLYQKEKIRNRINELLNEHAVHEVIIR
ncbi:MAG TPA: DUF721 domain-containing protein [Lacibacter sp.]|nr:DUF721 domain-containing protein [Lacibacter sp.]HMO88983.1 DUF721 domain-containing protein [Lacibacter sp.]HMP88414.1 DUF721 domain-containing protein [Lacibacter sp.]